MSTILNITKQAGVADQVQYVVQTSGLDYPTYFTGFTYGTPGAVFVQCGSMETYVTDPERFGSQFDESWIKNFYAPKDDEATL